jgi:hypothetical protein
VEELSFLRGWSSISDLALKEKVARREEALPLQRQIKASEKWEPEEEEPPNPKLLLEEEKSPSKILLASLATSVDENSELLPSTST